jgi:hypothetical protein
MKTNVKNGAFVLRTLAVDDGTIHIGKDFVGDGKERFSYLPFETRADGEYIILAETNEEGVVERLLIEFPEHATWDTLQGEEMEIDPDNIIIQDREE